MKSIEIEHLSGENVLNKRSPSNLHRIAVGAIATVAVVSSFTALSSGQGTTVENALKEQAGTTVAGATTNPYEQTIFHQSGFGGPFNVGHQDGERARRFLSQQEIKIPKSAVKHAIPSLARENIENLSGHYLHDEHNSPFSSYLYDRPKEELKKEQEDYEAKMNLVREEWGAWDFKDDSNIVRPVANFDTTPYKDLDIDKFPENSWQTDKKYVEDFISEANKLVDRMTEAIYAEYGHPTKKSDGTMLTEEEIAARNKLFKVHIADEDPKEGMSFINEKGMDALSRKLLHGMMTNDEFYFVLGGHSAAAGHGNNFSQQKTMQFHHIMEPVFHKLGMRLISRNLAMGGYGTIHYSMGQAELYGEKDFLMWDSAMTEKVGGDLDLFNKQALINGERVPIIFTRNINKLKTETSDKIWHGDIVPGHEFVVKTTGYEQVLELPFAARYVNCDMEVQEMCSERKNPNKYDAYCWVPRSDYKPEKKQINSFKSQASWHPGNRYHQFESRKAAMTILQGFKGALKIWEEGIKESGVPLKASYWHIGDLYKSVQNDLMSFMNNEDHIGKSSCERRLKVIGLERACRVVLHGMGEFAPINLGLANSIRKNAKNDFLDDEFEEKYSGINVQPLSWKIPNGEVDVHAIAIASTYQKPQVDHRWYDEGDDDDTEEDAESSRLLRSENKKDNFNSKEALAVNQSDRNLSEDEPALVPGKGWGIFSQSGDEITGYCDGSMMSHNCHRSKNNNCLLSGHNDSRNTISGDGLSGWLIVQIPKLKEGLIFAKVEWWHPRRNWHKTNGWTEVNNGNRSLGKAQPYPDDVFLDIAINGKIVRSIDKTEFDAMNKEINYNEVFYKLFDDENFIDSNEEESVEFGLRIRSESDPRQAGISIAHLYYA